MTLPRLAVAIMMKNEESSLDLTLKSLEDVVDVLFVFDTGSTDSSISKVRKWCEANLVPLHLLQGEFEDFSKSRNKLMRFYDNYSSEFDFIIHMDCADVFEGDVQALKKELQTLQDSKYTVFMISQKWFQEGQTIVFKTSRLLKPKCNWVYKHPIHEVLHPIDQSERDLSKIRYTIKSEICLTQTRTSEEMKKTSERLKRDVEMFLKTFKEEGFRSRDLFYLAQTYANLGDAENALKALKARVSMGPDGFMEEYFHSYQRIGDLYLQQNKHDDALVFYNVALTVMERAETYNKLSAIYMHKKNLEVAYNYCIKSLCVAKPTNAILMVCDEEYDYQRYINHSIVCFHLEKYNEGSASLNMAINYANNYIKVATTKEQAQRIVNLQGIIAGYKSKMPVNP